MIKSEVVLREPDHRYFNAAGREFLPVSRLISHFKNEFQSDMLSYAVARKRVVAAGKSFTDIMAIKEEQNVVLAEWKEKNRVAIEKGIGVHNAIETWINTTFVDPKYQNVVDILSRDYAIYPWKQAEVCLHTDQWGVAGTTDTLLFRAKSKTSVIDIEDYKSNKIERANKYGKYLLDPLTHMEECNYNTYAIQLSLYAYMLETQFGRKIGKLSVREIVDIEKGIMRVWPVPYMRETCVLMLETARDHGILCFTNTEDHVEQ